MITAALGRTRHTEAIFAAPGELALQPFPVISRAFAPMVRAGAFDVSEMAIATFLMARAAGSDLVLLPMALAARFQTGAMLRRADDVFGPADLRGRRVGVRAYSQTTGMWLRGILQEEAGVAPDAVRWTTFEDAHVPGFQDPAWVARAEPGADMLAMLRDGRLDAAIFGAETPGDADLAPVFPAAAADTFWARHGFVPVNHMVVVRAGLAGDAPMLMERFRAAREAVPAADRLPFGCVALEPSIRVAIRYAAEQGLLARVLTMDEVWAGLPEEICFCSS